MAKNEYTVSLTVDQRKALRLIIESDDEPAFKVRNARILLKSDTGRGGDDRAIAKDHGVSVAIVERIQRRFSEQGLEVAVNRRPKAKDFALVVNSAPDQGTFVDFGSGQVNVGTDGKTSVTYPGGSLNVGDGVYFVNGETDVSVMPSGDTTVNFPGGGAYYTTADGRVFVQYPDGTVFYSPDDGVAVNYPGGVVSYSAQNGLVFPGGGVFGQDGKTFINFPGGSVSFGNGGISVDI
jgi:hypothetical protein